MVPPASRTNLHRLLRGLRVEIAADDGGALGGESQRRGATHADPGPGDQRNLAGKPTHQATPASRSSGATSRAEQLVALFEPFVVAFAERDQQVPGADDLALLDQLLGNLLRCAADELLVAERGDRFVGPIEQRRPRRKRTGARGQHVEQGTLGPIHCLALLRRRRRRT